MLFDQRNARCGRTGTERIGTETENGPDTRSDDMSNLGTHLFTRHDTVYSSAEMCSRCFGKMPAAFSNSRRTVNR